jgi:cyclopropane fatty-acyl-phospholipid synthase-like methyltransferase
MAEWYEDWFNTEEYLNVYRHHNEADAKKLVELILSNISLPGNSKILDMACGPGRHSILFAQRGYKVTAVDLSENLLALARSTAKDFGLKINFIKSDMRVLNSDEKFRLAVNLFTSFGYFSEDEENYKILFVVYEHLEKNGYFILDYFNRRYIEKNLVPYSEESLPNGKIIQERSIAGNRVMKNITIFKDGNQKNYMESVRMYSINELLEITEKIGFIKQKLFGDFYGNPFDVETSPRLILMDQKC